MPRRLYWRCFWWGFTHPFTSRATQSNAIKRIVADHYADNPRPKDTGGGAR